MNGSEYGVEFRHDHWPDDTGRWWAVQARQAMHHPRIFGAARYLVSRLAEPFSDPLVTAYSEIVAVYEFVRAHLRYTPDPYQLELLYGPFVLLDLIERYGKFSEDCDGFAGLAASLVASLGYTTSIALVFYDGAKYGSHLAAYVDLPGVGGVLIDPSMKDTVEQVHSQTSLLRLFPL